MKRKRAREEEAVRNRSEAWEGIIQDIDCPLFDSIIFPISPRIVKRHKRHNKN